MMPALIAWTSSPIPGDKNHCRHIGEPRNVDFVLPHPDRLDQDRVVTRGIEKKRQISRRRRQSAELSSGRHRRMNTSGSA